MRQRLTREFARHADLQTDSIRFHYLPVTMWRVVVVLVGKPSTARRKCGISSRLGISSELGGDLTVFAGAAGGQLGLC